MEKKKTFLDLLMEAGDVAEQKYAEDLHYAQKQALRAKIGLHQINIKDAYRIGMADDLIKLQRNADALEYLLGMAYQVADYMRKGVREICLANDVAELHRTEQAAEIRRKQVESAKKAAENKKYRAKQKDQADAPDKPEESQEQ